MAKVAKDADLFAKDYESPGGGPLARIGIERFRCPEALFQPELAGIGNETGVHLMVHAAVNQLLLSSNFNAAGSFNRPLLNRCI